MENQSTWRETFFSATAPTTNAIRTSLELKMGLRGERLVTNHSNRYAVIMLLMPKMAALWP
jgi:hypothetical protein